MCVRVLVFICVHECFVNEFPAFIIWYSVFFRSFINAALIKQVKVNALNLCTYIHSPCICFKWSIFSLLQKFIFYFFSVFRYWMCWHKHKSSKQKFWHFCFFCMSKEKNSQQNWNNWKMRVVIPICLYFKYFGFFPSLCFALIEWLRALIGLCVCMCV